MELIQKLESLSGPLNGVEAWNLAHEGPWGSSSAETQLFAKALEGSLDAALALAERLHPCWSWSVGQNVHHKYWRAYALALDTDRAAFQPTEATSKTPALALCLAILKANHKDKP